MRFKTKAMRQKWEFTERTCDCTRKNQRQWLSYISEVKHDNCMKRTKTSTKPTSAIYYSKQIVLMRIAWSRFMSNAIKIFFFFVYLDSLSWFFSEFFLFLHLFRSNSIFFSFPSFSRVSYLSFLFFVSCSFSMSFSLSFFFLLFLSLFFIPSLSPFSLLFIP